MTPRIYTIGYAGWAPAALRDHVLALGATLVDVRIAPTSKSPQWRKDALAALMGAAYCHAWLPKGYHPARFDPVAVRLSDSARRLAYRWYGDAEAGDDPFGV